MQHFSPESVVAKGFSVLVGSGCLASFRDLLPTFCLLSVALLQGDATAAGAEHGVLVTTGRFSEPARQAAQGRHPTIDLVAGEKLTDLCLEANIGVALSPIVNEDFFDRFEDLT